MYVCYSPFERLIAYRYFSDIYVIVAKQPFPRIFLMVVQ